MATTMLKLPEATQSAVADHVAALRELAGRDRQAARETTWEWFERLGRLAPDDRGAAEQQLAALFATGRPSSGIDGPTDGILVAPLIRPRVDAFARRLTTLWMPWLGKSFYANEARGDNRLTSSVRWPAKLLWPRYRTRETEGGRLAFDFQTRIEQGGVDPKVDVLVIDYEPVAANPRFVIRRIRDELVEIAAGAHLGRILWRRGEGGYANIGYFALRTPKS